MDASIAVKPVFDRFQSVVITSGVSLNYFKNFAQNQKLHRLDACCAFYLLGASLRSSCINRFGFIKLDQV